MEKNDQQLDKQKEKFTERSRRSRLTGIIEENKNYIISDLDELSADYSYTVKYI